MTEFPNQFEQPSRRAKLRWRRPAWPWPVSVGLHLAFAIGAFFIVTRVAPRDEPARPVFVTFDDPAPGGDPLSALPDAPEPAPASHTSPTEPAVSLSLADLAAVPHASGDVDRFELPPASSAAPAPPMTIDTAARPEVRFGGLTANNARDIVYVVDASGSMVTTWPETRAELLRSVQALRPTQRFQVLLVRNRDGQTHLWASIAPATKKPVLIDATRPAKDALATWLDAITPGGTSDPRPALERALQLRPDAVFLLASRITGPEVRDFDPDALYARLDELNPVDPRSGARRVAIKTIQILETDPLGVLEKIGRTHGGENGHRFIGREELNLRGSPGLLRNTR